MAKYINVLAFMNYEGKKAVGTETGLPWKDAEDMLNFKLLTWHKPVLISMKTLVTIPNRLKGRRVFALTSSLDNLEKYGYTIETLPEWVTVVTSKEQALAQTHIYQKVFVIGGVEIYSLFADKVSYSITTMIDSSKMTEEPTVFITSDFLQMGQQLFFVRPDLLTKTLLDPQAALELLQQLRDLGLNTIVDIHKVASPWGITPTQWQVFKHNLLDPEARYQPIGHVFVDTFQPPEPLVPFIRKLPDGELQKWVEASLLWEEPRGQWLRDKIGERDLNDWLDRFPVPDPDLIRESIHVEGLAELLTKS